MGAMALIIKPIKIPKDKKLNMNMLLDEDIRSALNHIFNISNKAKIFNNKLPVSAKHKLKYGVPSGLLRFILW
jgi:hypothetical protein